MNLIFRYIFKKFLLTHLMLSAIFLCLIWLTQSLRYVEMIINNKVSLGRFFYLTFYLVPDLVVLVTPIAFGITLLYTHHKLVISHEFSSLKAIGLSIWNISKPSIVLGGLLTTVLVTMNIWLVPLAFQKFSEQRHIIQNAISSMMVREGSFNTQKNITVFIREHTFEEELKGIFIYQTTKDGAHTYTTFADSGKLMNNGDKLILVLQNGERHEVNSQTQTVNILSFQNLIYDFEAQMNKKITHKAKPSEKTLFQLLFPTETLLEDMQHKFKVEAHQRILFPFLCVSDAFLSALILLGGEISRRFNRKKLLRATVCLLSNHLILIALLNSSVKSDSKFFIAYFFVLSVFFLNVLFLLQKKIRLSSLIKKLKNNH